jgi:hypothetical protein
MPTLADCWRSAPGAFEQWLGAAIAALLGAAALYSTGPDLALQRGLVFVGGPLLWLSGLAPRLGEYLHAPARLRLLPLPLPALEHWRASAAIRRRGAALTALAGAVAIAVGTASHLPTREVAGLVGDWLWLSVVVVLVEPWAPAVAAWLGRRMPAESTAQRLARYKLPKGYRFLDALPRTAYGKVVKGELRDRYLTERAERAESP